MNDDRLLLILQKLKQMKDFITRYENKKRFIGAAQQSIIELEKRKSQSLHWIEEHTRTLQNICEDIKKKQESVSECVDFCDLNEVIYKRFVDTVSEDELKLMGTVEKIQSKLKEEQDVQSTES